MNLAVIGAGRVGTAFAVLLQRAGHRIAAVSGRGATRDRASRFLASTPVLSAAEAAVLGDLVLIAVPDDLILTIVAQIAGEGGFRPDQWVAHVSGASGLDVLQPAAASGAGRLAIHPLQTFPDVAGAIERIPGCFMALTADDEDGYAVGELIAGGLGARPFRLADEMRPRYHAAAVLASNDLVVLSSIAERLFREAGVPDPIGAMLPLQRATLDNVERLGPSDALTGPAVRGDATTIERNLTALRAGAPDAIPAYVALCQVALDLGVASGRLPEQGREGVEEVLARWR